MTHSREALKEHYTYAQAWAEGGKVMMQPHEWFLPREWKSLLVPNQALESFRYIIVSKETFKGLDLNIPDNKYVFFVEDSKVYGIYGLVEGCKVGGVSFAVTAESHPEYIVESLCGRSFTLAVNAKKQIKSCSFAGQYIPFCGVDIPDNYATHPAFMGCKFDSCIMETIRHNSFYEGCTFTDCVISSTLEDIAKFAFLGCKFIDCTFDFTSISSIKDVAVILEKCELMRCEFDTGVVAIEDTGILDSVWTADAVKKKYL